MPTDQRPARPRKPIQVAADLARRDRDPVANEAAHRLREMADLPSPRQLAEKIARRLCTNGQGQRADRLVLMTGTPERDLGGWCEAAIIDQIEAILQNRR